MLPKRSLLAIVVLLPLAAMARDEQIPLKVIAAGTNKPISISVADQQPLNENVVLDAIVKSFPGELAAKSLKLKTPEGLCTLVIDRVERGRVSRCVEKNITFSGILIDCDSLTESRREQCKAAGQTDKSGKYRTRPATPARPESPPK
jgi:hypothetical protein